MSTQLTRSSHTLRIGGVVKSDLLTRLRDRGVELNALALELFAHERFQTSADAVTVTVVRASVAELGLPGGGRFDEIAAHARARGYSLCPLELAPHLRLAFLDQAEGAVGQPITQNCALPGSITVASPPISEDDDVPKGFYLRVMEGVPWLRGYRASGDNLWAPTDVLAFVAGTAADGRGADSHQQQNRTD